MCWFSLPRLLSSLYNAISIESWIPVDQTGWVVMVEAACLIATDASFLMLDYCLALQPFRHQHTISSTGDEFNPCMTQEKLSPNSDQH